MKRIFSLLPLLLIVGCDPTDPRLRELHLAALACREGVKEKLKSPASARFSEDDGARRVNDSTIDVESWVDSQNSFGATIRTRFKCTVGVDSGKLKLDNVDMQS